MDHMRISGTEQDHYIASFLHSSCVRIFSESEPNENLDLLYF